MFWSTMNDVFGDDVEVLSAFSAKPSLTFVAINSFFFFGTRKENTGEYTQWKR